MDPALRDACVTSMAIGLAIAAGLATAREEWLWLRRKGALTPAARAEMRLSLSLLPPNLAASLLAGLAWGALYGTAAGLAPERLELGWATPLAAFVASDLSYYWEHRCAHRVGLLWRLYHAPHHSSPAYTVATAYRVSLLNQLLAPAFYLPWVLLGLSPILVVGFQLACFHYQAWLHTEAIGPVPLLDGWLNTPANHRIHHSRAAEHADRNMGAVLMLWDRIFGTYAAPAPGLRYGIHGEAPPTRWWQVYSHPWRKAP